MAYDTNSNIDNIFQHIKYQNGKMITQRQELSECYQHSNATEVRVEELLSYSKEDLAQQKLQNYLHSLQDKSSTCQNNGWLIDNIFCPISNKLNEFWEPLPAWGKDSIVIVSLATVSFLNYSAFTTPATVIKQTEFKNLCASVLESYLQAQKKDAAGAIEDFYHYANDKTNTELVGLLVDMINAAYSGE